MFSFFKSKKTHSPVSTPHNEPAKPSDVGEYSKSVYYQIKNSIRIISNKIIFSCRRLYFYC